MMQSFRKRKTSEKQRRRQTNKSTILVDLLMLGLSQTYVHPCVSVFAHFCVTQKLALARDFGSPFPTWREAA
jgi:hypothetical protein